ncbi:hypothetical protein Tco_1545886 [Tanacetum coccineum]
MLLNFKNCFQINELQAKLKVKDISITNLKKHIATLKGKTMVENVAPINHATVIAPGMFRIDFEPLSPKLMNNREAYIDYLKKTKEHADTLRGIVEQDRAANPLDIHIDYACRFTTRIQDLLVYGNDTYPSSQITRYKLVVVTPINRNGKVRMKSSTSTSRSQPSGNTNKNKISQITNSNKKNKVEDHARSVKSSFNKMNRVSKPVCNENVKHFVLNANYELIFATCNECMFDAIHDLCVHDYVNDVNVRQTFTIDGNRCPLTRITSTNVVPPKNPLLTKVNKKTLPSRNNSGMLKDITNLGSSSKSKNVESKTSNNLEPNKN